MVVMVPSWSTMVVALKMQAASLGHGLGGSVEQRHGGAAVGRQRDRWHGSRCGQAVWADGDAVVVRA